MKMFDGATVRSAMSRLSPRQRQYAALAAILAGGVGLLWAVFALTGDQPPKTRTPHAAIPGGTPTNIGIMAPGQQVDPLDQWVGTAGRKLAQYEQERDEQTRINRERKTFETRTMQRFSELERQLTAKETAAPPAPAPAAPPATTPVNYPPAGALPMPAAPPQRSAPTANDALSALAAPLPGLVHVSIANATQPIMAADHDKRSHRGTISSYMPVSFTRGVLLGGLDAPTGGQAQSNPQPVLIRLSDDSVLPNRFRGAYRECFVIAAGYGDIGSERAYLRTENLSCVRNDGATLEVKIHGTVYGEDGKVGMRGRLVTKQGQMLANALLAGIAGGIGQGLSTASTNYSTSALGTIASASGSEAFRAGLGSGVGRALDRLAQYYIKLAEQTFPVIEIDAGREVDVVITKGVRIDVPDTIDAGRSAAAADARLSPATSSLEGMPDEHD